MVTRALFCFCTFTFCSLVARPECAASACIEGCPQNSTQEQTIDRKISQSTLFQGLANSCAQVGQVSAAQNKKEKQQATVNLIASLFQFAADAAKDTEESKKKKKEKREEQQAAQKATQRTIDLTLGLLSVLEPEEKEKTVYLRTIDAFNSQESRTHYIEHILANKEHQARFLEEILLQINTVVTRYFDVTTRSAITMPGSRG